MASSSHHNPQIGTPALFDSFIFESIGLMPLYGDFVGVDDVDFMAYLALGHGPALYPLYASSSLEVTQSKEVPVYVSSLYPQIERLDFPPKSTRIGPDNRFYVVYDFVGSENSTTIVHLARHPTGYHPWGDIDFTTFASMSDSIDRAIIPDEYIASDTVMSDDIGRAYRSNDATFASTSDSVGHAIISNEYIASDTMMSGDVVRAYRSNDAVMTDTHYGDRYMTSEDLTSDNTSEVVMSNSPTIYSWISYSANMTDNGAPSVCQSCADRRRTRTKSNKKKAEKSAKSEKSAKPEKPAPSEMGLKSVMKKYPGVGNPHLLNFERKADAIRDTWPQALLLANIRADDLEEVASLTSSTPMSRENVLKLANPSLSEFIYDARRLALCTIGHSHAGFGFDDVPAGVLLLDLVQGVLQQFMRPKSNRFPIKDNGFAWFFGCQIAKEIMWHIIFRSSPTHGVRLVLADMEPATFRNVDHPPFPTMSLLGSSCYSAVLEKYSDLTNIPVDLLTQYPATEDVYDQLCETAVELVGQSDDEDHPKLMTDLSNLCRIVIDDVYRLGRPSKKVSAE
ncbi:hypothetical protein C8R48DRAFT_782335 [Suillus tomentosus]|nr:hypothetical protein C8R48DRAFT_782335 [Suillus tomentosus]